MAENKTKPTAANVPAYVRAIADLRKRSEARTIIAMMRNATGDKPVLWGTSIIGFGNYRYRTAAGREGDMPVVAYSPRQAAHVLYIMPGFKGCQEMLATLGRHRTGKSCLYVKTLEDIDQTALRSLIDKSVAHMRAKTGAHGSTSLKKPRKQRVR